MTRHVKQATVCVLCMKSLTPDQAAVWGKIKRDKPDFAYELFDWFHVECVPHDFVEIEMDED